MELLTVNELTITDSFFYIDGYAFLTSATTSAESKDLNRAVMFALIPIYDYS